MSTRLLAAEQGQVWLDISINDVLSQDLNIDYTLEAQMHWANEEGYYKSSFLSGGLGYRYNEDLSFWAGYEWDSHDNITDAASQNRLWEQMVWVWERGFFSVRTRTRFEQTNRLHESEWDSRFREKISFYFLEKFFFQWTPLIYDEFFIQLNHPTWNDNKTLEENRLFIGFDIPIADDKQFLEIGYLQQQLFKETGTEQNHILYVGINFNPLLRSFPDYVR